MNVSVTQIFRSLLVSVGSASVPLIIGTLLLMAPGTAVAQDESESKAQEQAAPAQAAPEAGEASAPYVQGKAEAAPRQAEAGPAQEGQPTPAVDDRPLPPPPPTGGSQGYPADGQYPPPPPDGVYRPFSFTLGAGLGLVRLGPDAHNARGLSYALRFGFGVQPNLNVTLGFEGATGWKDDVLESQDAFLVGLQYFLAQVLYVRGAFGVANETVRDAVLVHWDQTGLGFQGAVGVDLVQGPSVALSLEAAALLGRYADATSTSGGINLLLSLY